MRAITGIPHKASTEKKLVLAEDEKVPPAE
jgi:hypothetical protein